MECSKMAISVGIKRIVVLADYPKDGTQLLSEANIELVKLNSDVLQNWIAVITNDPEISAKAAKGRINITNDRRISRDMRSRKYERHI
jgi:dCMP deaminase